MKKDLFSNILMLSLFVTWIWTVSSAVYADAIHTHITVLFLTNVLLLNKISKLEGML